MMVTIRPDQIDPAQPGGDRTVYAGRMVIRGTGGRIRLTSTRPEAVPVELGVTAWETVVAPQPEDELRRLAEHLAAFRATMTGFTAAATIPLPPMPAPRGVIALTTRSHRRYMAGAWMTPGHPSSDRTVAIVFQPDCTWVERRPRAELAAGRIGRAGRQVLAGRRRRGSNGWR